VLGSTGGRRWTCRRKTAAQTRGKKRGGAGGCNPRKSIPMSREAAESSDRRELTCMQTRVPAYFEVKSDATTVDRSVPEEGSGTRGAETPGTACDRRRKDAPEILSAITSAIFIIDSQFTRNLTPFLSGDY